MTQFVSSSPDVTFSFNCVANMAAARRHQSHLIVFTKTKTHTNKTLAIVSCAHDTSRASMVTP